jgi:predicted transcriptional regulator
LSEKQPNHPTDAELEILQVLWQNGASTVRFVNEELNRKRPIGYTTTLKTMQIMTQKQMLERNEEGRSHLYKPLLQETPTQGRLLNRFVENAFGGSALKLVMQALGDRKTSTEELRQIKDYLNDLERES